MCAVREDSGLGIVACVYSMYVSRYAEFAVGYGSAGLGIDDVEHTCIRGRIRLNRRTIA